MTEVLEVFLNIRIVQVAVSQILSFDFNKYLQTLVQNNTLHGHSTGLGLQVGWDLTVNNVLCCATHPAHGLLNTCFRFIRPSWL